MSDGEVPEDRCGFVLEPEDIPKHAEEATLIVDTTIKEVRDYEAGSDEWYKGTAATCCWREVWYNADNDRCIWHAEVDNKPAEELIEARTDGSERLDGASVPDVILRDDIDFEKCGLQAASFDGTDLAGASFENIFGRYAEFKGATLRHATFSSADLGYATSPTQFYVVRNSPLQTSMQPSSPTQKS